MQWLNYWPLMVLALMLYLIGFATGWLARTEDVRLLKLQARLVRKNWLRERQWGVRYYQQLLALQKRCNTIIKLHERIFK